MKSLKITEVKNKTVLVRGSLDVPTNEGNTEVADDFRLHNLLPTVNFLNNAGCRMVICGKKGRPKGVWDERYSLRTVAKKLAELLGVEYIEHKAGETELSGNLVFFSGDIRQEKNIKLVKLLTKQNLVVLENLEFYEEELKSDIVFAKKLAGLAEMYVDDDFSKCHHQVASNTEIVKYLPGFPGLLLAKEIKFLSSVLKSAKRPFVVITGGLKLKEKIGTLEYLGERADKILAGGSVATLMFKAKGFEVGVSKIEEGEQKMAWQILQNFKEKIVLPSDVVVAEKTRNNSIRVCLPHEVRESEAMLDIGPKTIHEFSKYIKNAKTIVWSGALGKYEERPFHHGTFALTRLMGGRGIGKALVVAGGGDTVDVIKQTHQLEHFDHVSTGGGAMLEFLAGKQLPGIEALKK